MGKKAAWDESFKYTTIYPLLPSTREGLNGMLLV